MAFLRRYLDLQLKSSCGQGGSAVRVFVPKDPQHVWAQTAYPFARIHRRTLINRDLLWRGPLRSAAIRQHLGPLASNHKGLQESAASCLFACLHILQSACQIYRLWSAYRYGNSMFQVSSQLTAALQRVPFECIVHDRLSSFFCRMRSAPDPHEFENSTHSFPESGGMAQTDATSTGMSWICSPLLALDKATSSGQKSE